MPSDSQDSKNPIALISNFRKKKKVSYDVFGPLQRVTMFLSRSKKLRCYWNVSNSYDDFEQAREVVMFFRGGADTFSFISFKRIGVWTWDFVHSISWFILHGDWLVCHVCSDRYESTSTLRKMQCICHQMHLLPFLRAESTSINKYRNEFEASFNQLSNGVLGFAFRRKTTKI